MALDKAALSAKLQKIKNLVGVRAVAPGVTVAPGERQERSFLAKKGSCSNDAMAFEKAGWTFVKPRQGVAPTADHDVVIDTDGHLKVVGHALNVKFKPTLSRDAAEGILGDYGLSIRRAMGFSPNLFLVTGAKDDMVSKAKSLNQLDTVVYAEPVLIEPIKGR
jgi:hypothetical protein